MTTSYSLIKTLPPGKLDIIGDIHGEIDSLCELLQQLGFDDDGLHPESRHLVFVGDCRDRGPHSPATNTLGTRQAQSNLLPTVTSGTFNTILKNQ